MIKGRRLRRWIVDVLVTHDVQICRWCTRTYTDVRICDQRGRRVRKLNRVRRDITVIRDFLERRGNIIEFGTVAVEIIGVYVAGRDNRI